MEKPAQFSVHALERMRQRGISLEQVQAIIAQTRPFRYFHEGVWKTGYYDPVSKIFVGQAGNTIATVMAGVSTRYIESLTKELP